MSASIVSVNVGQPERHEWAGRLGWTAIRKHSVTEAVCVRARGLDGDQVADTRDHGGTYKAVYAFAQEDLDYWTEQLGEPVAPGVFGENLTTAGIDVNEALIGERWRIGTALLEVVDVRIPCTVFKNWLGVSGFDSTAWVKRFAAVGRPGPYLRVLEEGFVRRGDAVVVEHEPDHDVTVSTMFEALMTDRSLLPRLLELDRVSPEIHEQAREYAARV